MTPNGAALSEAEAQLAAVLRSAHGHAPSDDDVPHADHASGDRNGLDGVTTGEFPAVLDHVVGPEHGPTDTAEHLSALFNTPSPWDEPGQRDTSADLAALFDQPDLWRDAAAPDPAPAPSPAAGDQHHVTPEPQRGPPSQPPASDDAELQALVDAFDLEQPHDARSIDRRDPHDVEPRDTSTYPAERWPWVTKYGDGGFWAPPDGDDNGGFWAPHEDDDERQALAEHAATPGRQHDEAYAAQGYPSTTDPGIDRAGDPGRDPTDAIAADELDRTDEHDVVAAEPVAETRQVEAPVGRVRTMFRHLGGWTAVAQIALLAVGMLCVIQIFVLVALLSYLHEGAGPGGNAVASMASYGKIDSVMLPALFAFAVSALVLATWRGFAARNADDTHSQPLGLPVGLWAALAGVVALLSVILASQSTSSIAEAQRVTRLAIIACGVLGLSCFVAPRGLA